MRHLLWVRCHDVTDKRRVEKAIKCADLFIHSGGWGVVVLDLSDISPEWVRRLPTSYWYRFRRAVENTPTALVVMEREPYVKTCASLAIEMSAGQALWSGAHKDFRVLSSVRYGTIPKKPMKHERPSFSARALA